MQCSGLIIGLLRRRGAAWLLWGASIAALPAKAQDVHNPDVLFDVSDDEMDTPIGVVADVAVRDSIVYLLDRQAFQVRRITLAGSVLEAMGQFGEGPGDLSTPERLSLLSDGRCIVFQTFGGRAVCFGHDGRACEMLDLSPLKDGYASVIWLRVVPRESEQVLVSLLTTSRPVKTLQESFENSGTSASVKRMDLATGHLQTLFSTDEAEKQEDTVSIPPELYTFVIHGWDINRSGTMLYADTGGAYRVVIGHPVDGGSRAIDLPQQDGDEDRLHSLAKKMNMPGSAILPRIASVRWLDDHRFVVKPTADVPPAAAANSAGTYEVFDSDGSSFGRFDIRCGYDPNNDQLYLCGDILVVVRGVQAVARSAYRDVMAQSQTGQIEGAAPVEEVRVAAYRLFSSLH
ncbi:MAG TPA: hypothetical protein VFX92_13505 [Candidatus Krumholzibacteria bacterium]|nr:hypothetical protein [Candidatus Krumholzibacteria bacterium]